MVCKELLIIRMNYARQSIPPEKAFSVVTHNLRNLQELENFLQVQNGRLPILC